MQFRHPAEPNGQFWRNARSRTTLMAILVGGGVMAQLPSATAANTNLASVSGLSWRSGAHCGSTPGKAIAAVETTSTSSSRGTRAGEHEMQEGQQ